MGTGIDILIGMIQCACYLYLVCHDKPAGRMEWGQVEIEEEDGTPSRENLGDALDYSDFR